MPCMALVTPTGGRGPRAETGVPAPPAVCPGDKLFTKDSLQSPGAGARRRGACPRGQPRDIAGGAPVSPRPRVGLQPLQGPQFPRCRPALFSWGSVSPDAQGRDSVSVPAAGRGLSGARRVPDSSPEPRTAVSGTGAQTAGLAFHRIRGRSMLGFGITQARLCSPGPPAAGPQTKWKVHTGRGSGDETGSSESR